MKVDSQLLFHCYKETLERYCQLSDEAWHLLESILEIKRIPYKQFIVQEGRSCRYIDFVYKGSFRTYHLKEGQEITTALYLENSFVTDMKSLSHNTPSILFIQATEETWVVRLHKERLIELYKQSAELQTVGRAILQAMVIAESEWKQMYTLYDAKQRYRFLLQKEPGLLQRFPLQFIASFLGMSRETLSRIRGKL